MVCRAGEWEPEAEGDGKLGLGAKEGGFSLVYCYSSSSRGKSHNGLTNGE